MGHIIPLLSLSIQASRFYQGIARHEHYLALKMGLKENMTVLDVGCGVGGPGREMIHFTGANVVGLKQQRLSNRTIITICTKGGD